jgi:Rieske Fe-S protein
MHQDNAERTYRNIDYLIGISVLILTGILIFPPLSILWPRAHQPIVSSLMVPVADEEDLLPGSSLPFVYRGQRYLAVNVREQLFALSAACSETGGLIQWDEPKRLLVCPSNGGTYDVHGNVVSGLSSKPLETLNIRVAGGKIYAGR